MYMHIIEHAHIVYMHADQCVHINITVLVNKEKNNATTQSHYIQYNYMVVSFNVP